MPKFTLPSRVASRSRRLLAAILAAPLAQACAVGDVDVQSSTGAQLASACSPEVDGLRFVCGPVNPEDLMPIPGTAWLLASGYNPGGGLPAGAGVWLVDTRAKRAVPLYTGAAASDPTLSCGPAPPPSLETHGLYLQSSPQAGVYRLYAVSHAPRESVETFTLDARGALPTLTWTGCALLPDGYRGNGVAAFSDGTMLVTVLNAPDRRGADGSARGIVIERGPGDSAFHPLEGTDVSTVNGIEISRDEREIYVVGFADATVNVFARSGGAPLRSTRAPGFVPDNLHWSGDRLIATGPTYDEPACGGTRREAAQVLGEAGRQPGGGCNRGYVSAAIDPVSMSWKILAYAEPNPQIGIISAGVVVDDTLWIGAALSPGVAYRPLPRPAVGAR